MTNDIKKLEMLMRDMGDYDKLELKKVHGKIEVLHKRNDKYVVDLSLDVD